MAPVAGACLLASLLAGVAQVGFKPTAQALKLDFRRINPASGLRNLLGPNTIFEALKAIAKVGVVGRRRGACPAAGLTTLAAKVGMPPSALGVSDGRKRALDRPARRLRLRGRSGCSTTPGSGSSREQLRMTKQEVKDETRQYGISAEVKNALRRRQMQAARARMMAAVPKADVVVTNPTHYAVALVYDGSRTAPRGGRQGQGPGGRADQARRRGERRAGRSANPPLARALHSSTEIGQIIPQELYAAVAQVLAFVYRLAGRRRLAS